MGCEHLLLAVSGTDGPAGAALRERGARQQAVEEAIVSVIGTGPGDNDEKVALAALGIDLDEVRTAVEATFGAGALDTSPGRRRIRRPLLGRRAPCGPPTRSLPFTSRAKRCLELSLRESLRLNHRSIGAEHVALALTAHDDTVAWRALVHLGVDPAEVRVAIEETFRRTA